MPRHVRSLSLLTRLGHHNRFSIAPYVLVCLGFLTLIGSSDALAQSSSKARPSHTRMTGRELHERLQEKNDNEKAEVSAAVRSILAAVGPRRMGIYDQALVEVAHECETVLRNYSGQALNYVPEFGDPDVDSIILDLNRLLTAGLNPPRDANFEKPPMERTTEMSALLGLLRELKVTKAPIDRVRVAEQALVLMGRDRTATQRFWWKELQPTLISSQDDGDASADAGSDSERRGALR